MNGSNTCSDMRVCHLLHSNLMPDERFVLLVVLCKIAELISVELLDGETYQLPVTTGRTRKFYLDVSKLPSTPSHAVFQVHSQWNQVKVSFDDNGNCDDAAVGRYSVGTNVGLVSLSADRDPFSWCLSAAVVQSVTFKVLVMVLVYRSNGG